MAAAAEQGVGVMARVPTSSGLLDDNVDARDHLRPRRPPPPPSPRVAGGGPPEDRAGFGSCASPRHGRTMAQAALRFILAQPQMTVRASRRSPIRRSCASTPAPPTFPTSPRTSWRASPSSTSATSTSSPCRRSRSEARASTRTCRSATATPAGRTSSRPGSGRRRRPRHCRRRCRWPHRQATRAGRGR